MNVGVVGLMVMLMGMVVAVMMKMGVCVRLVFVCPAETPYQVGQAETDKQPCSETAAGRFEYFELVDR